MIPLISIGILLAARVWQFVPKSSPSSSTVIITETTTVSVSQTTTSTVPCTTPLSPTPTPQGSIHGTLCRQLKIVDALRRRNGGDGYETLFSILRLDEAEVLPMSSDKDIEAAVLAATDAAVEALASQGTMARSTYSELYDTIIISSATLQDPDLRNRYKVWLGQYEGQQTRRGMILEWECRKIVNEE